jgi:uncharacterized protein
MLNERLSEDQKAALRAGEKDRLRTIRSLRAALTDREIELRKGGAAALSEADELQVLQKQAKQRRDSIEQFREAGRTDLAEREEAELEVIESYLPAQLSDDALRAIIEQVIAETGASSTADLGRVMGPVMAQTKGQADGRRVNMIVRELLGGA